MQASTHAIVLAERWDKRAGADLDWEPDELAAHATPDGRFVLVYRRLTGPLVGHNRLAVDARGMVLDREQVERIIERLTRLLEEQRH